MRLSGSAFDVTAMRRAGTPDRHLVKGGAFNAKFSREDWWMWNIWFRRQIITARQSKQKDNLAGHVSAALEAGV
jgi:hypothetical protein